MKKSKLIAFAFAAAIGAGIISGCGTADVYNVPAYTEPTEEGEIQTYAFVAKDVQNTYMRKIYDGFETACKEIGADTLYKGPESVNPNEQAEIIDQLTAQGVSGIAIAANDAAALEASLTAAESKGVKIISIDSAVYPDSRQMHIQQVDPEKIGRGLVQAAYKMVDGNGGIAVLSSTVQVTNQNLWIDYMKREINANPDKYRNTPIVKVAYGDDDPVKSAEQAKALISDPSVKIIIAPTTVGMRAAAEVIEASGSEVKLTGLGLPSEMAPYIEDGICPWMYLWNPVDIGYLAGYTLDALVSEEITGESGEVFKAGTLGEKAVTQASDGGTEVILGEPYKFDSENIGTWKDIY